MSSVTYIGGVVSSHGTADRVGNALGSYYENIEAFTYSNFVNTPDTVLKAMKDTDLVTHSGGALAVAEVTALPNYAYLLNPPLPRGIGDILCRSLLIFARSHSIGLGIKSLKDFSLIVDQDLTSLCEVVTEPMANLGNLSGISKFDAVEVAIAAKRRTIPSTLVWTSGDAFFQPDQSELERASQFSIPVKILPGEHSEVLIKPEQFLSQVFS